MRNLIGLALLFTITACSHTATQPEQQAAANQKTKVCDLPYTKFQSTVTGYCQEVAAELPKTIPSETLTLEFRPVEQIPEVFWFNQKLAYTLNQQPNSAPLAFVIAGTGAAHDSPKMKTLQKTLFSQGYHVVSLSSPTYPNYIINATTRDDMVGDLAKDAKSLYAKMSAIYEQLQSSHNVEATSFSLTGYSLGGAHSAFISQLDEEAKAFNFEKVVLINPPVSLYNSVQILDGYLDLEYNRPAAVAMVDRIFDRLAEQYALQESSELSQESIYSLFAGAKMTEEELKLLIGASFRMSSADMMFAIDATYNIGALIYKNHNISKFESITHSMHRADDITFTRYFDRHMLPWTQKLEPNVTRDDMIERLSLVAIEDYLKSAEKVTVVTNQDDIILAEGEVDYLREVFGARAQIFERGGHCGNMDRHSFVEYMRGQFVGASTL
ncbi:hypothetical protein [Thalassotalea montiporae]